jgi:hypothetical protein
MPGVRSRKIKDKRQKTKGIPLREAERVPIAIGRG